MLSKLHILFRKVGSDNNRGAMIILRRLWTVPHHRNNKLKMPICRLLFNNHNHIFGMAVVGYCCCICTALRESSRVERAQRRGAAATWTLILEVALVKDVTGCQAWCNFILYLLIFFLALEIIFCLLLCPFIIRLWTIDIWIGTLRA